MQRYYFLGVRHQTRYEGAGDGQGQGQGEGQGEGQGSGQGEGQTKGQPRTFTQDELNKFLADDRRKNQKLYNETLAKLETISQTATLTAQEKAALEQQIEEMKNQSLTKEEILKKENDKISKEAKKASEMLAAERDGWKSRYTTETIMRTLTDAAIEHEAFAPEQVNALLLPNSRLVETVGEDGKPNGGFAVKVKFNSTGSDGQPVTLDLEPKEAVKLMREQVDKYGNLFKSTATGGLGGSNKPGGGIGNVDLSDPAAYRKLRKSNPDAIYNVGAK